MTKKDYILLVNAIKDSRADLNYDTAMVAAVNVVMKKLATELQKENERFELDVFMKACW